MTGAILFLLPCPSSFPPTPYILFSHDPHFHATADVPHSWVIFCQSRHLPPRTRGHLPPMSSPCPFQQAPLPVHEATQDVSKYPDHFQPAPPVPHLTQRSPTSQRPRTERGQVSIHAVLHIPSSLALPRAGFFGLGLEVLGGMCSTVHTWCCAYTQGRLRVIGTRLVGDAGLCTDRRGS